MADADIDFETLSAYVDGELPAERAALVAATIASDPILARSVAKLHAIKAAIGTMTPDVVLAPIIAPDRLRPPHRSWGKILLPIAAALVLAITAALWPMVREVGQQSIAPPNGVAELVTRHNDWSPEPAAGHPPALSASHDDGIMRSAGLHQVFGTIFILADGRTAQHRAFVGERGCRVSLFRVTDAEGGEPQERSKSANLLTADWRKDGAWFLLVARDMDETRFATIAEALRSPERGDEPAGDLVARLQTDRSPCLA